MMTQSQIPKSRGKKLPYEDWMEAIGVPIYRGHYVEDLRTVQLSWWEERECEAAFLDLKGMQGVSEGRIQEIRPGATLPKLKMAVGELIYPLTGQGLCTVWLDDSSTPKTFEWNARSLFHIPRHSTYQLSNARGDSAARLLLYNYLPIAMSAIPDPDFLINNPHYKRTDGDSLDGAFSQAVQVDEATANTRVGVYWNGNFFPDLGAWDKLSPYRGRGAGGTAVYMRFPGGEMGAHMSVFDQGLYKKAHRHGPGRVIVIPRGEGYSLLWRQGPDEERIICPWHEASVFVPPEDWYHQHFNVGTTDARYLALGSLSVFGQKGETDYERAIRQIEYPDEDAWVRETFEAAVAERGGKSFMPDGAYSDPDYEWDYGDD
jgi:hypothetical protein